MAGCYIGEYLNFGYNSFVAVLSKNIILKTIKVILTGIAFAVAFAVPVCAETTADTAATKSNAKMADADAKIAQADAKIAEAEAKKTEADLKKAEADLKKAEVKDNTPSIYEARLESCLIYDEKKFTVGAERGLVDYVEISGKALKYKGSHHPELYLFELKAYQDNICECESYVDRIGRDEPLNFKLPLLADTEDTRLFSSFVLARKYGGEYYPVSNRIYVTNPEHIASSNIAYGDPPSKKGLLIDFGMTDDAMELGVKRVIINIDFDQFVGEGITYKYNGNEYQFSEGVVAEYDRVISTYSSKEMQVTAVVLNAYNEDTPELRYDQMNFEEDLEKMETQQGADHLYYHFNTNTEDGMETTAALASFLAERYSGESKKHGRVSNWIIGNEINNPNRWNYMGDVDFNTYISEYARSFRVFYNAMKSRSANAKLFFSIDYDWVYRAGSGPDIKYGGKVVVNTLNSLFKRTGNIDWNLAYHPYPSPMSEPEFWDDKNCIQSDDSPIINFKNLSVLTDYLSMKEFLDTKGAVRDIILSEEGFTSYSETKGDRQDLQAAAFAYAYYIADNNEYIDAFILSRQVDAPLEMEDGLYFGLWACDPSGQATEKKVIWDVFKDIDDKNATLEATAFAKPLIGIERWSDVIPGFKPEEKQEAQETQEAQEVQEKQEAQEAQETQEAQEKQEAQETQETQESS